MKKNYILVGAALGIFVLTTGTLALNQSFNDVAPDHWAYTVIEDMKTDQLLSGYSDGSFRPNQFMTRAEVVSLLDRSNTMMEAQMEEMVEEIVEGRMAQYDEVDITYNNSEYGFSLTLPKTWKNYMTYKADEKTTFNEIAHFDFGFDVEADLFMIFVFDKTKWEILQKEEGPKPTYLGEKGDHVFAYSTAQDAANADMEDRLAEVSNILKSFTLTK